MNMNRFVFILAIIGVLSCTACGHESSDKPDNKTGISAKKKCWNVISTKADEVETVGEEDKRDTIGINDVPWLDGEKVLLLGSDQTLEKCRNSYFPYKTTLCTVYKADGMKCALIPDTTLEEGVYRAFYPVYDFAWYDMIHFSFLYEIDEDPSIFIHSPQNDPQVALIDHQDIVVSDSVSYKKGEPLEFVLNHILALIDIDIYPPKTGKFTHLKLAAEVGAFGSKVEYYFDGNSILDQQIRGEWLNFTPLRCSIRSMEEGVVLKTSTGLLPVQYDGLPVCIHIIYEDGTHYVSEPFAMPSLCQGVENQLVVKDFKQTNDPLIGFFAKYGESSTNQDYIFGGN